MIQEGNGKFFLLIIVIVYLMAMILLIMFIINDVRINNESGLGDIIVDSCSYGCIHSTRYYYNCSGINFADASYECFNECHKLSEEIKLGVGE